MISYGSEDFEPGRMPTLETDTEVVEYRTLGGPEPDPDWTYTDKAGHQHHYTKDYPHWPTLKWILDRTYWCESCQDDHEEGHWACAICEEEIKPGEVNRAPRTISRPGRITYLVDGEPVTKERFDDVAKEVQAMPYHVKVSDPEMKGDHGPFEITAPTPELAKREAAKRALEAEGTEVDPLRVRAVSAYATVVRRG